MTIGSPALRRMMKRVDGGAYKSAGNVATYGGIYFKASLYALLTLVCAVAVEFIFYSMIKSGNFGGLLTMILIILAVSAIPLLILALVITFIPSTVKVLGFFYAAIQGLSIGLVSALADLAYPGIAFGALLGTMVVFLVALVVNSVFRIKLSSGFIKGLMVAFFSLLLVQFVMWMLSLFNVFSLFDEMLYFWIQFVICVLCVIWATCMLFFDLYNIDYIVGVGADKEYEWYVAFSLVSTLIYMYIQILELLLRLALIFSSRK